VGGGGGGGGRPPPGHGCAVSAATTAHIATRCMRRRHLEAARTLTCRLTLVLEGGQQHFRQDVSSTRICAILCPSGIPKPLLGHCVISQGMRPTWPPAMRPPGGGSSSNSSSGSKAGAGDGVTAAAAPAAGSGPWAGLVSLTERCWAQDPQARWALALHRYAGSLCALSSLWCESGRNTIVCVTV
jgi:hypothetical protein